MTSQFTFDRIFSTVKQPKKSNKHKRITFNFKSSESKTNPNYSLSSGWNSSKSPKNNTIYATKPKIKFLFTYNLRFVKLAIVTVKS